MKFRGKKGDHKCGARVLRGGECADCKYVPVIDSNNRQEFNHGGKCPKCGGMMLCRYPVFNLGDRCHHHRKGPVNLPGAADLRIGLHAKPEIQRPPKPMPLSMARHLPANLSARFESAMQDDDLLSIRSEVSLSVVRQMELAERLYGGEAGSLWKMLGEKAADFRGLQADIRDLKKQQDEATAAGNDAEFARVTEKLSAALKESQSLMVSILDMVEKGNGYESAWRELMEHSERVAKFKEREHSRLVELRQFMDVKEAMCLAGALIRAVVTTVKSREERIAVATKVHAVLEESKLWAGRPFAMMQFGEAAGILRDAVQVPSAQSPGAPMTFDGSSELTAPPPDFPAS